MLGRPKDEKEKQLFDAVGTIRAARFVKKYAKTRESIDIGVVYTIHNEIYKDWWPEMAGKPREEEVKIWHSKHLPPHHSKIREHMSQLNRYLRDGLELVDAKKLLSKNKDVYLKEFLKVLKLAALVHHGIVWIHPFVDGNGRAARALATMVLFQRGYDVKKFFSIEEYFDRDAARYYKILQTVSNQDASNLSERDLTVWLEYFCEDWRKSWQESKREFKSYLWILD